MNKPKHRVFAGHCGVCGCAVVRPTATEVEEASKKMVRYGLFPQKISSFFLSGHFYTNQDSGPELKKVRCHRHVDDKDSSDPRSRISKEIFDTSWH